MAYINNEAILVSWNQEFRKQFHLGEHEAGIPLRSIGGDRFSRQLEDFFKQAAGGMRITFEDELFLGAERMLAGQITLVPDRDEENRVAGVIMVITDNRESRLMAAAGKRANAILKAVSVVVSELSEVDSFESRLSAIVGPIGMAADASRAYIFRNDRAEDGSLLTSQICEWTAPGIASIAELENVPMTDAGFGRWVDLMRKGEAVRGMVREFPETERIALLAQGIRSVLAVPIYLDRQWWGFVGFDECSSERTWAKSEQDALQWTAEILSSLIRQYSSESALRKSNLILAHAQKAAKVGVFDLNTQTCLLTLSEGTYRILGLPHEEFGGSFDSFISDCVYPDDRERFRETVENALRNRIPDRIELRIVRPDGEVRTILVDGRLIDDRDGNPVRAVGIIQDITGIRESEERLKQTELRWRSVLENMPDFLLIVDRDGKILFTNRPIRDVPLQEVSGRSAYDFLDPAYREQAEKCVGYVFESGKASSFESRFQEETGAVWYTNRVGPQKMGGEVVAVTIATSDITRQVESEEELRISARRLRALASRLHQVREEESASISREIHDELGQALTVLKMDVSWVQRRLMRIGGHQASEELLERLTNMSKDISETIHTVRRISTQLRPGILDDLGLIDALEWHARVFEDRTGIRCDITRSTPDIHMNTLKSSAVFRIFQEILTNVARHAEAERVEVELRVKDDVLIVRVHDNGRGISPAAQGEIRSLGILGMRERALVCGGNLTIRGEEGKGTEVSLRIPLTGDGVGGDAGGIL